MKVAAPFWRTSPLVRPLHELGIWNGLLYLLSRSLDRLTRGRCRLVRYYIVAQPVPENPIAACRPSVTEIVAEATAEDAAQWHFPRPPEVIARRFANGNRCLVSLSKGRFAGFLWLAHARYDEDEVHCHFVLQDVAHTVWDFDVAVEPQFRMGRTFVRLWDAANASLAREGVRWSISRISAFNRQSIHSHGRMGTVTLDALTFLCIGPLQWSVMTCAPFVHVCWKGRRPPRVLLAPPPATNV